MKTLRLIGMAVIAVVLSMSLYSCSDDDDDKIVERIAVTQSEIQGDWRLLLNGNYYALSFTDDSYTLNVMDTKSNWVHRERGTYQINGFDITADADVYYSNTSSYKSIIDGNTIYWESELKNYLHIFSLGAFYRYN